MSHITFEEVYAMPYVQSSIEAIVDRIFRTFPKIRSYKDDIRQELIIYLAQRIHKFDPERSGIKTFCRLTLKHGINRVLRNYWVPLKSEVCFLSFTDILEREMDDDHDHSTELGEALARLLDDSAEKNVLRLDVMEVIFTLSPVQQQICFAIMAGDKMREIMETHNISRRQMYHRVIPELRLAFIRKKVMPNG